MKVQNNFKRLESTKDLGLSAWYKKIASRFPRDGYFKYAFFHLSREVFADNFKLALSKPLHIKETRNLKLQINAAPAKLLLPS